MTTIDSGIATLVVGLLTFGAATTATIWAIRSSGKAERITGQIMPNGTGHPSLVAMIEDMLIALGKQEAWMESHEVIDANEFGHIHSEVDALKSDINDHLRPNVHQLINQLTAVSGLLQMEDVLNKKLADIKSKQEELNATQSLQ